MQNFISNEFVHELELEIDAERILQFYYTKRTPGQPFLSIHYIVDPYLTFLYNTLPGLSQHVSFFWTTTSKWWPPHIDMPSKIAMDRNCALNVPLKNCNHRTDTIFYDDPNDSVNTFTHVPQNNIMIIGGQLVEKFRFNFTKPCVLNVQKPHAVLNKGSTDRLLMSWSISTMFDKTVENYSKIRNVAYDKI
jgi:hypothetical protein